MNRPGAVTRRAFLGGLAAFTGGCTGLTPNLEWLYAPARGDALQTPAILVPGLLGSRLVEPRTGEERWPGNPLSWLVQGFGDLALPDSGTVPAETRLVPAGITDSAVGRDFYGRIVDALTTAGGYVLRIPGQPPVDGRPGLYLFAYDWRQDNVQSARALDAMIEQIRLDCGQSDLRVDVVAHSMGGLITRYLARYGTADVLEGNEFPVTLDGERKLRRVVLLGTPNLGSVMSLRALTVGFGIGPFNVPPEVVATMPGAYQLLPHAITDWIVSSDGTSLERDQFDVEVWERFQWGIFDPAIRRRVGGQAGGGRAVAALEADTARHLERARRFTWSLTVPTPGSRLRFAAFGGVCRPTPARVLVEERRGESVVRFRVSDVGRRRARMDYESLMEEPGDGTVTKSSLLGRHELDPRVPQHRYANVELDYPVFLCAEHTQLTGNPSFQDNLLHYLLRAEAA